MPKNPEQTANSYDAALSEGGFRVVDPSEFAAADFDFPMQKQEAIARALNEDAEESSNPPKQPIDLDDKEEPITEVEKESDSSENNLEAGQETSQQGAGQIVLQSIEDFDLDDFNLDRDDLSSDAPRAHFGRTRSEIIEARINRQIEEEKRERANKRREKRDAKKAVREAVREEKRTRKTDREKYIAENKWTKERTEAWQEKLAQVASETPEGAWLSEDEKAEAPSQKAADSENEVINEPSEPGRAENLENGENWRAKRYKFENLRDVWDYTWAAGEVMHYEKNTVVGSQNLELQLNDDVAEETPELRRQVLISEHWKWVKEVLATDEIIKFHDQEVRPITYDDQRRVQRVYVDYLDSLEQPGHEKDSFTEYMERVKPISEIDGTEGNFKELEEMAVAMNNNLLTMEDAMGIGRRYYSEEEVGALMQFYQAALEQVGDDWRKNVKIKEFLKKHPLERLSGFVAERLGKIVDEDGEIEGVPVIDVDEFPMDAEENEADTASEEGTDVAEDVVEDMTEDTAENEDVKERDHNKALNLNVLLPGEEGIQQLRDLVEYCKERFAESKAQGKDAVAAKWREQISILNGHIALSEALLAAKITERERRAEMHKREKEIVKLGEEFNDRFLIRRLMASGDIDVNRSVLPQLEAAKERYQTLLNQAVGNDDTDLVQLNLGKLNDIDDAIFDAEKNAEAFEQAVADARLEMADQESTVEVTPTEENETTGEATA